MKGLLHVIRAGDDDLNAVSRGFLRRGHPPKVPWVRHRQVQAGANQTEGEDLVPLGDDPWDQRHDLRVDHQSREADRRQPQTQGKEVDEAWLFDETLPDEVQAQPGVVPRVFGRLVRRERGLESLRGHQRRQVGEVQVSAPELVLGWGSGRRWPDVLDRGHRLVLSTSQT
jgi:hypothetical protein